MCRPPSRIHASPSLLVTVYCPNVSVPAVSSNHTNSTLSIASRTGSHVSGPLSGSSGSTVLDRRCGASAKHRLLRQAVDTSGQWPRASMSAIGAVRRPARSVLLVRLTRPCVRIVCSQTVSGAVLTTLSHLSSVNSSCLLGFGRARPASTSCSSAWCTGTCAAPSPRLSRGKRAWVSAMDRTLLRGSSQCGSRARRNLVGRSHTGGRLCGSSTSCRGCRIQRRPRHRLIAVHAELTTAISLPRRVSAPAAEVCRRRCTSRLRQLVSRSAVPRERQVGSRASVPN